MMALTYAFAGKVNWLMASEYVVGGIAGGWLGARLAGRFARQKQLLTCIFAGISLIAAVYMLWMNLAVLHL